MFVRYNGGRESFYSCTKPSELILGKTYEVISKNDRGYQTDYTLKGIKGQFNSAWFEVSGSADIHDVKVYRAKSHCIPKVGERYSCYRWKSDGNGGRWQAVITSPVEEIVCVEAGKRYKVLTQNSKYLVRII